MTRRSLVAARVIAVTAVAGVVAARYYGWHSFSIDGAVASFSALVTFLRDAHIDRWILLFRWRAQKERVAQKGTTQMTSPDAPSTITIFEKLMVSGFEAYLANDAVGQHERTALSALYAVLKDPGLATGITAATTIITVIDDLKARAVTAESALAAANAAPAPGNVQ